MGIINIGILTTKLINIRDQSKHSRKHCANQVLKYLGFPNSSISTEQFDALLIRAIVEHFDNSRDADVLLMAFGLLQCYHYTEIISIGDRRKKYLAESNYLQTHPRKQEPYVTATEEKKEKLEENLRKAEDIRITSLAKYLVEQTQKEGGIEKYVKSRISPIAIPQPSYILLKDKPVEQEQPKDDDISEGVDESDNIPPEDGSNAAGEQKDAHSETKAQPSAPGSSPDPQPHGKIHIGPISISPVVNIGWKNIKKTPLLAVVVVVALLLRGFPSSTHSTGDIFFGGLFTIVTGDIIMSPNTYYSLVAADSLDKTSGSVFSYVSSDPSIVAVGEHNGILQAAVSHPVGGVQTADITIKGENGATVTKAVSVDFDSPGNNITLNPIQPSSPGNHLTPSSGNNLVPSSGNNLTLDDFVPDFTVSQKIRIAGDTEWHNYVDAKVGDELEIQFEYRNISENEHVNVAVRDILPSNLGYIPGSTTIYTAKYPEGVSMDQNDLVASGIGIGTYGSNANAYIRFKVRVVDINLADGVTGLVNWSQASVNGVTLQDFATVRVSK